MPTETTKKLFTVDEYYKMAEVGILGPEDRVELIDGEIIQMSPIGMSHAGHVNTSIQTFSGALGKRTVLSVQNPVRLDDYNEPEPDVALLKPRIDCYRSKRVLAEDVLLLVEVADTTLEYDRDRKSAPYARLGIPEVWIEDLQNKALLVFRDPEGDAYRTNLSLKLEDSISIQAFPDVVFKVAEFLG